MRLLVPLTFGLIGTAVLVWLGLWQLQRLEWKEGVLAGIEARIASAPVALPATATEADRWLAVAAEGRIGPEALRVLVSRKQFGAGYRVISAFETTDGRRILLDRGFIALETAIPPGDAARITGNLHLPDDRTPSTPANDEAANIWFARDVARMAEVLRTEPLLVVARSLDPAEPGLTPLPVDTATIPNDHFGYAMQWFGLAVVWTLMTGYFLWRNRRTAKG